MSNQTTTSDEDATGRTSSAYHNNTNSKSIVYQDKNSSVGTAITDSDKPKRFILKRNISQKGRLLGGQGKDIIARSMQNLPQSHSAHARNLAAAIRSQSFQAKEKVLVQTYVKGFDQQSSQGARPQTTIQVRK